MSDENPGSEARTPLAIRCFEYPWTQDFLPPDPERPYWRTTEGQRHALGSLLAGTDDETRAMVVRAHGDAIAEIAHAAGEAKLAGGGKEAHRLVTAMQRLSGELVSQFPQDSWAEQPSSTAAA